MHIFKFSALVYILLIFLLVDMASGEESGAFTFRAGLGYDFVSQEYFIDSVRLSGGDSLLELSLLEKDYLDDKKALLFLRYQPDLKGQYILEGGWEQTTELFRASGRGFLALGDNNNQLQAEFIADTKKRYRGEIEEGEEMTILDGTIKLKRQLFEGLSGRIRLSGESVNFDTSGLYIYNYSRLGGDLDFNFITGGYNSIYAKFGLEKRIVPDTVQLDYNIIRGGLGYLGSFLTGLASAEITVESKKYNQLENPDDYFLTSFQADLKLPMVKSFSLIGNLDLENYDFDEDNYINEDYRQAHFGLHGGWQNGDLSLSLGPEIEFLAIKSEFKNDDDYFEFYIHAGLDYFREGIFIFLDNQVGHRKYRNNPLFYSNFIFDRLSLIGSLTIFEDLNADLLLSGEWEWHSVESDNSRLYLLSLNLTYTF